MIEEFVKKWDENKEDLRENFFISHPESYKDILKRLISEVINPNQEDGLPSNSEIEVLTFGDWEGVEVFVVPETMSYPSTFWVTKVYYGSCSMCDTLRGLFDDSYDEEGDILPPNEKQVDGYMTLALHMLQRMKEV
jgi:hypothetical protein